MDESNADDGAIHRFWTFAAAELMRRRLTPGALDDVVFLLFLIILFDQVADTIPEPL